MCTYGHSYKVMQMRVGDIVVVHDAVTRWGERGMKQHAHVPAAFHMP